MVQAGLTIDVGFLKHDSLLVFIVSKEDRQINLFSNENNYTSHRWVLVRSSNKNHN